MPCLLCNPGYISFSVQGIAGIPYGTSNLAVHGTPILALCIDEAKDKLFSSCINQLITAVVKRNVC